MNLDRLIGGNVFAWMLILCIPIIAALMLFGRQSFAEAEKRTEVIVGLMFLAAVIAAVWAAFHYA